MWRVLPGLGVLCLLLAAATLGGVAAPDLFMEDFSGYTLASFPPGWTLYGSPEVAPPIVIQYGGGEDQWLEFTDRYNNEAAYQWMLRDGLVYTQFATLQVTASFQTENPGTAGIVLGWKDERNLIAVLLDQANNAVHVYQFAGERITNIASAAYALDWLSSYTLEVAPGEIDGRGYGTFTVRVGVAGGELQPLFAIPAAVDLRGRVGIGVFGGSSRVVMDNFVADGAYAGPAQAWWTAPGGDGAVVDVFGDTVTLTMSSTVPALWGVQIGRWDDANLVVAPIATFFGPPPYAVDYNTAQLAFGETELRSVLYGVDGSSTPGPWLRLNRVRAADAIARVSPAFSLRADGRDQAELTVEVRDRGGNLLPGVEVTFSGTLVTAVPPAVMTGSDGRATTTIRAGKQAGVGAVVFASGSRSDVVQIPLTASSALYLPALLNDEKPANSFEQLVNGDFEQGAGQGWQQLLNGAPGRLIYHKSESVQIPQPQAGAYVAWLGGAPSQTNLLVQETAPTPLGVVLALEYRYFAASYEAECYRDRALVAVRSAASTAQATTVELLLCAAGDTNGWRVGKLRLDSWVGQPLHIEFETRLNETLNSNWFLDDVRLCTDDPGAVYTIPRCTFTAESAMN